MLRRSIQTSTRAIKMQLKTTQKLVLPPTADMHVHLRQDALMRAVAPTVTQGGVDTAFV